MKRITLDQHEVIVPGFLAQDFNVDLKCGHANNFLVQNVLRPLVDKLAVNCAGATVQEKVGYDIRKILQDLFLSVDERDNTDAAGGSSKRNSL